MEHEFCIDMRLRVSKAEAEQLLNGQRKTFRKVDPFSQSVTEANIGCNVCNQGGGTCLDNPVCPGPPIEVPEEVIVDADA